MPSITSWMRLEPRSRNAEMKTSLQANVYDPLWLLARQWQFGEFQGEDNGSPILAHWQAQIGMLNHYHAGAISANPQVDATKFDSRRIPIETLVERETVHPDLTITDFVKLRMAVEGGQHLLRLLEQQPLSKSYHDLFKSRFPFPSLSTEQKGALDQESLSYLKVVAPRVPDGRLIYTTLRPIPDHPVKIPTDFPIAQGDIAEVETALQRWIVWWETFFSEPESNESAWSSDRMEYGFSFGSRLSDDEHILTAEEYYGGHLDWYAFNLNPAKSLGTAMDVPVEELQGTAIPAPITFRGMPAPRFWEFEDAKIDFGSVEAGPTDLARMLLVEFALSYGNDWFVVPVELEAGSICQIKSFILTDTFGVRTRIRASGEPGMPDSQWRMFQLSQTRDKGIQAPASGSASASNLFFLPPSLMQTIEGSPIEEVLFMRDEIANLAWGIERLVESGSERALNRFEMYIKGKQHEQQTTTQTPLQSEALHYRLTTDIPDYWVPLMPVRVGQELRLNRGAVIITDGLREIVPMGRILESGRELSLFEEEVPREGIRVTRSYQFARWIDGSSHLWVGRRKTTGRGEGSSGLRYDLLNKDD